MASHLGLPPVATYAGLCLWNHRPLDGPLCPDIHHRMLDNTAILNSFTGSIDEQWFYLVSIAMESRGAPAIPLVLDAFAAARRADAATVTTCLRALVDIVDDIGVLLSRMPDSCTPQYFYTRIRPFLAGSKNMVEAGMHPDGLIYDDGRTQTRQAYGGGSNAQSSLIQFFDLALGIEHHATGTNDRKSSNNFILDMRRYMPGPHRRFLERIAAVANIRPFVNTRRDDDALCAAYDSSLAALRDMRDRHIQIVTRYIIIPSREARNQSNSVSGRPKLNLAHGRRPSKQSGIALTGTGGTALIPFLKQARDETSEASINERARHPAVHWPIRVPPVPDEDVQPETVGLAGTWLSGEFSGGICLY